MRINVDINARFLVFLIASVDRLAVGHRLECLDGFTNEADIEVKADASDVTRLLSTQHIAGPAHFKVFHGDGHTGAEIIVLRNRR